jgi:hypothetical protein
LAKHALDANEPRKSGRLAANAPPNASAMRTIPRCTGIKQFLTAAYFSNARCDRFKTQHIFAYDFAPNPDFKPHLLRAVFVNCLLIPRLTTHNSCDSLFVPENKRDCRA